MELGTILILGALAFGAYRIASRKSESNSDSYYKEKYEDEKKKNEDLREDNQELVDKVNPNENEHQPDLTITGTMTTGGTYFTHNMIVLHITNNSAIDVEIGDFKCDLYMAGYKSFVLQPANIAQVVIKPGKTVDFKLYARGGQSTQSVWDVWSAFENMINSDPELLAIQPAGEPAKIPVKWSPIELDIAFLWFWKGGYERVNVYNVPCAWDHPFLAWTVGSPWVGYNRAADKAAGSLWNEIEKEENGEE